MRVQKYVVLLDDTKGREVWLAYNSLGRIGNAQFEEAFRYDSYPEAENALERVRNVRRWPKARILGTTEEVPDDE